MICVVAASSILLVNAMMKLIPQRWVAKVPQLDESKSIGGSTRLMQAYDKQAKAKAFTKKGQAAEAVAEEDPEADYNDDENNPYGSRNNPYSRDEDDYKQA